MWVVICASDLEDMRVFVQDLALHSSDKFLRGFSGGGAVNKFGGGAKTHAASEDWSARALAAERHLVNEARQLAGLS